MPQPKDKDWLLLLISCFSRVRLCDPIDGSSPGFPIPGILQARTLEWVSYIHYKGREYGDLAANIGSTNEKPFTNIISNQPTNTILIIL